MYDEHCIVTVNSVLCNAMHWIRAARIYLSVLHTHSAVYPFDTLATRETYRARRGNRYSHIRGALKNIRSTSPRHRANPAAVIRSE